MKPNVDKRLEEILALAISHGHKDGLERKTLDNVDFECREQAAKYQKLLQNLISEVIDYVIGEGYINATPKIDTQADRNEHFRQLGFNHALNQARSRAKEVLGE